MGRPYSLDLRERVLAHVAEFGNITKSAEIFKIHKDTINNWRNRSVKNKLQADKSGPKGAIKIDITEVIKYLENNIDSKLEDLAKEFKVTPAGIWYALKRNGYIKKNSTLCRKARRTEI